MLEAAAFQPNEAKSEMKPFNHSAIDTLKAWHSAIQLLFCSLKQQIYFLFTTTVAAAFPCVNVVNFVELQAEN